MTFLVGAAAHGSPGVSTALQLVASLWPVEGEHPVIIEADATGGVLAARHELALSPGFATLAESLRKFESPDLLEHSHQLPSGVPCVPISPSATAASAQLRTAGAHLAPYLTQLAGPVLFDCGMLLPDSKAVPAVESAELLVWFVRANRDELLVLRHRLTECAQPDDVVVVLVGDTSLDTRHIASTLGVDVMHTLPIDRRAASAVTLGGDDQYLRQSQLAHACAELAALICSQMSGGCATAPIVPADSPAFEAPLPPPARPAPSKPASVDYSEEELLVWVPDEDAEPHDEAAEPDLIVWVNDTP